MTIENTTNPNLISPPSPIKLLDQETINKIAAGEVIENPSCIMRELLDNAIDSGANKITVRVNYDDFFIEVLDNGCGISHEHIKNAFTKHATSKISNFEDVYETSTLGFRGEALASIASVSDVVVETATNNSGEGIRYHIKGGKEMEMKNIASEQGTRIQVKDLFFNTPIRRKFFEPHSITNSTTKNSTPVTLRNTDKQSLKRETIRHLLSTDKIALQYWVIDSSATKKEKLEINIPLQSSFLDKILIFFKSNAYGESLEKCLLPVNETMGNFRFNGYISNPSIREYRSDKQFFIIKNRVIKNPLLLKAVSLAYLHTIPRGSHPMIFLRVESNISQDVDLNVHPRKEQVKFKHQQVFFEQLMRTIKNTLLKSFTTSTLPPSSIQEKHQDHTSKPYFSETPKSTNSTIGVLNDSQIDPFVATVSTDATDKYHNPPDLLNTATKQSNSTLDKLNEQGEENIKSIKVLGQIAKAFIVFAIGEDLFVVDQHAAHERINFDRLLEKTKHANVNTQMLLIPLLVEKSTTDKEIILSAQDTFKQLGFAVEDFGNHLIRVTEVPAYLPENKIHTIVNAVLESILNRSSSLAKEKINHQEFLGNLVASMACRMSIMSGDILTNSAMESLIKTLYQKGYVYTCPHGRPFVKKISLNEMKLFFDRGRHINGDIES